MDSRRNLRSGLAGAIFEDGAHNKVVELSFAVRKVEMTPEVLEGKVYSIHRFSLKLKLT